jgi:phosphate ABC transporter phosphate-binding protein
MPALSAIDLAMFMLETRERPFNIGPLVLLHPPAGFKGSFADKLHARLLKRPPGPPFNYRLVLSLTHAPSVEPMANPDIRGHVHRLTLQDASMAQLLEKVCELHEAQLDRSGLLWHFYVIDGLADGSVALYGKVHHGIIDGRTFVKAVTQWMSEDPKDNEVRAVSLVRSAAGVYGLLAEQGLRSAGLGKGLPLPFLNVPGAFDGKLSARRSYAYCTLPLAELKAATDPTTGTLKTDVLHIPTVLGAVVATYNLPGVDKLQFSGETLADIFLGKITAWNDPKIAADNPGVTLPDTEITVAHRSDGSGTTSIFTNYLSSVSPEWKTKVGAGDTVQWPTGQGGEKNPGVAAIVQQTEGAIGYVELIYAAANKLPEPAIKNAAGKYVAPTLESVSAAAAGFLANTPDDLRVNIVNPPAGDNAYPISGYTWILVTKDQKDEAKAQALTDFLYWALTSGSDSAKALNYAPLPDQIREKAIAKLAEITVNGKPAFVKP